MASESVDFIDAALFSLLPDAECIEGDIFRTSIEDKPSSTVVTLGLCFEGTRCFAGVPGLGAVRGDVDRSVSFPPQLELLLEGRDFD